MNKIVKKVFNNIERISCMYGDIEGYEGKFYEKFKESSNTGYFGCKLSTIKGDTLEQRGEEYIPRIRGLYIRNNVISNIPETIIESVCSNDGKDIIINIHTRPDTKCIFNSDFKDLECQKGE